MMNPKVFLLLILASVLLIAACQSERSDEVVDQATSLCGSEYVYYRATLVSDINFLDKTVTPFSPSDESCRTLVSSQFTTPSLTQPALVLLEDTGFYTLEDLGYQDIVLHSWEPSVLRQQGNVVRRHTRIRAEYQLPDDAAQGPEIWYVFRFHFELEFTENVEQGRAQVTAYANGYSVVANSSFGVVRQGDGELVIESSRVLRAEQEGNYVEAWSEMYFSDSGIRPGDNTLSFAVSDKDGAVVQTFRVFADSVIEVTTVSPFEAALEAEGIQLPDYSNVTPPCDAAEPACLAEHVDSREPDKICEVFGVPYFECLNLMTAALEAIRPTPSAVLPDYEEIFLRDPAISDLLQDLVRNTDYWLRIRPIAEGQAGDIATAELVFAEPVDITTEFTTASDPCSPFRSEGYVRRDRPCWDVEPVFGSEVKDLDDVFFLAGSVYGRQGVFANPRKGTYAQEALQHIIEDIEASEGVSDSE